MHESKQDTAIILLDYTTIPPITIDANQTSTDSKPEILLEYNTTIANEVVNVTTVLDEIQNTMTTEVADQGIDTITTLSDVTQNETSTVIFDDNEYSNETLSLLPTTTAKPICDQSCQCSRKCPYGFEILNNTCQCDPPCTVSFSGKKDREFFFRIFIYFKRIINVSVMIHVLYQRKDNLYVNQKKEMNMVKRNSKRKKRFLSNYLIRSSISMLSTTRCRLS